MTREQKIIQIFAQNLKRLRLDRGYSQHHLCEVSLISRTTIGFLEAGRGNPPLTTLMALAHALEVSIDDLTYTKSESQIHRLKRRLQFESFLKSNAPMK